MKSLDEEIRSSRQAAQDIGDSAGRKELIERASRSGADFMRRLREKDRRRIDNPDGSYSTHLLAWATDDKGNAIVFPEIQPDENGNLRNYGKDAVRRATEKGDTLTTTPELAEWFTANYKKYFPPADR